MNRVPLLLMCCGLIAGSTAYAADQPSERLMTHVLADHFRRYFCASKFPELRAQIQRAYDHSRLKYIAVPCQKLQCADPQQTKGMQTLLEGARERSESESRALCAKYPESVRGIENEYAEELNAVYPPRRRKK